MTGNSYLLIPLCKKNSGTGHLRRMINLYHSLKEYSLCSFYIPESETGEIHRLLISQSISPVDLLDSKSSGIEEWDICIFDYRKTPVSLIDRFKGRSLLAGIDEGGLYRNKFDFLIDVLPSLSNIEKANISSPGLLNLPQKHEYTTDIADYKKILITFGGEDPMDLTTEILEFIHKYGYFVGSEITVVVNSGFCIGNWKDKYKFLISPDNLREMLKGYDLVVTGFGFTPFESLACGIPFILLNPSEYHGKLAAACGFPSLGVVRPSRKRMDKYLVSGSDYRKLQEKYIPVIKQNLIDIVGNLEKTGVDCPVCKNSSEKNKILCRTDKGNYYRCSKCTIIYYTPLISYAGSYRKEYFFEDYKKQYGSTYLEDFQNIQNSAAERLTILMQLGLNPRVKALSLLDVGCAYGPFLAESENFGYTPEGVELVTEAADYVRSVLGYSVSNSSFEDLESGRKFDLLTMWYVIEHFDNLKSVLIKVNKLLKSGAFFAFSTPGSTGISGRRSLYRFLKNSPSDHLTVWNPGTAKRILRVFGFRVRRVRITGHHPERFPAFVFLKLMIGEKGVMILSKIFRLGDTFEIYAEKIRDYNG